jgi:hypothetical protein
LRWAKVETLNQQELVIKQQKYYLPAIIIVIVINGFFMWIPSGVIKHGIFENPGAKWRYRWENHGTKWW